MIVQANMSEQARKQQEFQKYDLTLPSGQESLHSPRQRAIRKKEHRSTQHAQKVQEHYLNQYHEAASEAADYYKRQAVDMYLTENYCGANRYLKPQYTRLC